MAPITPEEMRQQALDAQAAAQRERDDAKKKEKDKRKQAAKNAMDRLPDRINSAEWAIKNAAEKGRTSASMHWMTQSFKNLNAATDPDFIDIIQPVMQAVVDHFTAVGFKAEIKIENQTVVLADGSGPGDDKLTIEFDWSE